MIEWTDRDSKELQGFVQNSVAGQKLVQFLRERRPAIAKTLSADIQPTHEAISIGACKAHGWEQCVEFLDNLGQVNLSPDEDPGFIEN